MMQYKGYVAAVEFDESVGRLHDRVTACHSSMSRLVTAWLPPHPT